MISSVGFTFLLGRCPKSNYHKPNTQYVMIMKRIDTVNASSIVVVSEDGLESITIDDGYGSRLIIDGDDSLL